MLAQAASIGLTPTINSTFPVIDVVLTWNASVDFDLYTWEPNTLAVYSQRVNGYGSNLIDTRDRGP